MNTYLFMITDHNIDMCVAVRITHETIVVNADLAVELIEEYIDSDEEYTVDGFKDYLEERGYGVEMSDHSFYF